MNNNQTNISPKNSPKSSPNTPRLTTPVPNCNFGSFQHHDVEKSNEGTSPKVSDNDSSIVLNNSVENLDNSLFKKDVETKNQDNESNENNANNSNEIKENHLDKSLVNLSDSISINSSEDKNNKLDDISNQLKKIALSFNHEKEETEKDNNAISEKLKIFGSNIQNLLSTVQNQNNFENQQKIIEENYKKFNLVANQFKDQLEKVEVLEKHKQELLKLQTTILEKEKEIQQTNNSLEQNKQQLEKNSKEIEDLKQKLSQAKIEMEKVSQLLSSKGQECELAKKNYQNINEQANQTVTKLNEEQEKLKQLTISTNEKIQNLTKEKENLSKSINDKGGFNEQIQQLRKQAEQLTRQNQTLSKSITDEGGLNEQITNLTKEKNELTQNANGLNQQITNLTNEKNNLTQNVEQLNEQITNLTNEKNNLTTAKTKLEALVKKLRQTIFSLIYSTVVTGIAVYGMTTLYTESLMKNLPQFCLQAIGFCALYGKDLIGDRALPVVFTILAVALYLIIGGITLARQPKLAN